MSLPGVLATLCLGMIVCGYTGTAPLEAQTVRVLKFADAKPFHMGNMTSRRVIQPDVGAKQLTLNYSESGVGSEFAQHVHDYSDDTILVLKGTVDLRQGDQRTPVREGNYAFIPSGQIHGTITTAPDTIMISFQVPPDLVLYTGARDSSKPGAAPPKGVITPGAVKYASFADHNGFFVSPRNIARRAAAAYRRLQPGESFTADVASGGEQLLFVWKGAIRVEDKAAAYSVGLRDTLFASGPVVLKVRNDGREQTVVVQVQSPAQSGW